MILRHQRRPVIRQMEGGDAARWQALRLEALLSHPEAFCETHDDWAARPLEDFRSWLSQGCVFGAFIGADLVGSTELSLSDGRGELSAVYVQPAQRGHGVAQALLLAAERAARRAGARELKLSVAEDNAPAMRFYEAAGFVPSAQGPRALARDGRLMQLIVLTKPF